MQGHRSSITTLPENLNFDNNMSTSSDAGIDSQISWNATPTSPQNLLPEYRMPSSQTNTHYLRHVGHESPNGEWSLGESSSRAAQGQGDHNVRERQRTWTVHSRTALTLEERQYDPWNTFSMDANGDQTANGLFVQQPLPGRGALTQDLNMHSEFGDHDADCQIVERPNMCMSIGPSNDQMQSTGTSLDSFGRRGYVVEESEERPGFSLDGRRISCKRKAIEEPVGQSSGAGSSNWHPALAAPISAVNNNVIPTLTENDGLINNGSNPRPRAVSASPVSLSAESSRRNLRLRISGSHQQEQVPDNPFSTEGNVGNTDVASSRHSSRHVRRSRLLDLNPPPPVENESLHRQPVLAHVPSARRNPQSRWSGASSSRERNVIIYEESSSRSFPVFDPPSEIGSSSQQPTNLNPDNNIAENVASSSWTGFTSGVNSSAPSWTHRSCPQYPRRLSEIVRRSLISSVGSDSGGDFALPSSITAAPPSSGSGNHDHRLSSSRSALLERHLDGAFGVPSSLRNLVAASEGRSSIMSEQIRHVLDLMRRGEALRFEDVMILDHSVLFGMADMHDRHRDMRLDVDNMSYEELLALEERIGNVCTGLNEETIVNRLKLQTYVNRRAEDNGEIETETETETEMEPCSICREEYNDGEDIGKLDCGHDFHKDCIKQWLMQKNLCPICKTTGLST